MRRLFILLICLVANILIWQSVYALQHQTARIVFLNVGQGDAIYIESPSGNQMLVDGGRDQAVLSELRRVMPWWDRSIDLVLATHPDADHIGGLADIFARYRIDAFISSGNESDTAAFDALERSVNAEHAQRVEARRGQVVWLDDDMYFAVLFPEHDAAEMEANASSIIGKLVYGESGVMLSGDAPSAIEQYLVSRYGDRLESEILKAGHHGSHTSTAPGFLAHVSPQEVVISAEKDSRYGHPHREVVELISAFGAEMEETAHGRVEYELYLDGRFVQK